MPVKPAEQHSFSHSGIALLRELEGCRLKPYDDATGRTIKQGQKVYGYPTIGVGHVIKKGEGYLWGGISPDQADRLLLEDLQPFIRAVRRLVRVNITQEQFDALVCFCFNIGEGSRWRRTGFVSSTTLRRLNAGDIKGAAEAMFWWNKTRINGQMVVSDGLIARRRKEVALFLRGSEFELAAGTEVRRIPA